MDYRMVFDAGSRVIKCAIADETGKILEIGNILPETIQSKDGFGRRWNEQNYWNRLLDLAEIIIKKTGINSENIRYISSCSIRLLS